MIPEYATRARSDKSATGRVWVLVVAGLLTALLVFMHNVDQRAYNHCVGVIQYNADQQTNAAVHAGTYTVPYNSDTSVCHKAWP